jgi:hypothetical protein
VARRGAGDPDDVVPAGPDALRAQLEAFVAAGASKFVVAPLAEPGEPEAWEDELGRLAEVVLPLQA